MSNLIINLLNKFFVLLLFFFAVTAEAFVVSKHDITQSIEVLSDNLEILENSTKVIFEGDVKTSQGDLTIYANRMEAVLSSVNSKLVFEKIQYIGNIKIKIPDYEIFGDQAFLDFINQKLLIKGNLVIAKDRDQIKAENLVYDFAKGLIEIQGNKDKKARVIVNIK